MRLEPELFNPGEMLSAEAFARLATELHDVDGVEKTIEAVAQFALQAVWCKYASVVLIARGRQPEVVAMTDQLLADLYQQQIDVGAGPLITAVDSGQAILIRDTTLEARWSSSVSDNSASRRSRTILATLDGCPSQIGVAMIRMFAARIFVRIAGHSSPSPSSVETPKWTWWSTTRITSPSVS
jgi:hypothetical protein